jgi:steroid 5-alpha reductase family enzyme
MLVGITLPLWAVNFSTKAAASAPIGTLDIIAATLCVCGITIGFFADTQLYNYCTW